MNIQGLNTIELAVIPNNHPRDTSNDFGPKFKHFWGYTGKSLLATRFYLNALARNTFIIDLTPTSTPEALKSTATHLKLFSIIGVPYKLSDICALSGSFLKSIAINDDEGIKMTILTMTLLLADLFDSVQSYINAVLALTLQNPFEFLPSLALPAGLTMSCAGSALRTIKIVKAYNLHESLQGNIIPQNASKAALIEYLNKQLGINEVEADIKNISLNSNFHSVAKKLNLLISKKEAIIHRMIPKEARESFTNLMNLLKRNEEIPLQEHEYADIHNLLTHIQIHVKEKGHLEVIGLIANILILSAVFCLKIGIVTSLPYFLFAISFTIRLGIHVYENSSSELLNFHNSIKGPLSL
jgi:hypothetical protein